LGFDRMAWLLVMVLYDVRRGWVGFIGVGEGCREELYTWKRRVFGTILHAV
jgi:hypothetical protein